MSSQQKPRCKHLVLDAGPLLSLTPLRGLSEAYYTVPQVLAELKDKKAREHLKQLASLSGVKVAIKSPDAESLVHVIRWAKKTGDYSALSHPDLCVLALTYMLHTEGEKERESQGTRELAKDDDSTSEKSRTAVTVDEITERLEEANLTQPACAEEPYNDTPEPPEQTVVEDDARQSTDEHTKGDDEELEALNVELHSIEDEEVLSMPLFDDPSDDDDGEGEWITPDNVELHKSKALGLLPSKISSRTRSKEIWAGCMTGDFAMQNVLLQMGLDLVGVEGRRIEKIKTWVLRCHACYKLCKDNSKKFCPSCGNPTLVRASVTVSKPGANPKAPALQVHLKKNFQYRLRGTKYSIPAPKPGSAKTGTGEGLILREDQLEYMRAKKRLENKNEREEARIFKGMANKAVSGNGGILSSWMDPDWVPEMMSAGMGGKGRSRNSRSNDELPKIGYGRRNPNERGRSRK